MSKAEIHPTTLKLGWEFLIQKNEYEITGLHYLGHKIIRYDFARIQTGEEHSRSFEEVMEAQVKGILTHNYPSDNLIDSILNK
jgi:hypothetical protein